MRRVVITGMGAITPLGLNVEEFWNGLKEGRHGFGEITRFDASEYKAHLAGEVKGFVGKEFMDAKAAKRMELFCQYAVAATKEAIEEAGLDMEKEDAYRVGCSVGSGIGRTKQNQSFISTNDDFQHGSGKCIDSVWIKRKELKCRNCLCNRNKLYR